MEDALAALTRPVRLLAAGGTIAMRGERAVPVADAHQLVEEVPGLRSVPALEAESLLNLPSAHLSLDQALNLAHRARDCATNGEGVVITTGTDTLEEIAVLCSLVQGDTHAPIVITGANRPGSAPGADGQANLIDAVAAAGSTLTGDLGTIVVFAGEIHAGMSVRKVDSTSPAAFGSPHAGPIGRVVEGRIWVHARPIRPAPLQIPELAHRVEIVTTTLGDDGAMLRHAAATADGLVLVALGAGHIPPPVLRELDNASTPVLVTCRPQTSSMLFATYGFEGAERDIRGTEAIPAPFLSPQAARIALLCCLGAGLDRDQTAVALAPWDAHRDR